MITKPAFAVTALFFGVNFISTGCGVKTPPTPLLPSADSVLDKEIKTRKKEQKDSPRK
ncbi:MAG: hypothetical protein RJB13_1187 [Pseudomonadota bacterium]|jgi:hypothetical protein